MADDAEPGGVKEVCELAGKLVLLPGCVSALQSTVESPSTCGAWQGGLQGVEAMVAILTGGLWQGFTIMSKLNISKSKMKGQPVAGVYDQIFQNQK